MGRVLSGLGRRESAELARRQRSRVKRPGDTAAEYIADMLPWARVELYGQAFMKTENLKAPMQAMEEGISSIEDRIVMQKAVFLLEKLLHISEFGAFHYCWDIYGPYSPSLASAAGELVLAEAQGEDVRGAVAKVSKTVKNEVDRAVSVLDKMSRVPPGLSGMTQDVWMELLACILFLREGKISGNGDEPEKVKDMLNESGKSFDLDQVQVALRALKPLSLDQRV